MFTLLLWLALFFMQVTSLATRPPISTTNTIVGNALNTVRATPTSASAISTSSLKPTTNAHSSNVAELSFSTLITIAPVPTGHIELRANSNCRCFNDQGFSVDCATWTGYYYTWGPPNDPCLGGPGQGGGSNGNGNGFNYVYSGANLIRPHHLWKMMIVSVVLLLLFR